MLQFEYTDKIVSPWGGIRIIQEGYVRSGLKGAIENLDLIPPGSGNGENHSEIIESFLMSVILGADNCTSSSQLRYDKVVKEIFGWKKGMPSQSTLSRFFRKYDQEYSDFLFEDLQKWWFNVHTGKHLTLDIDSTVITRYGNQEGAEVGYNREKPGRKSHHPLLAFIAEHKMVVNAWIRTGNSASSTDFEPFLSQTLQYVGKEKIGLLRADSGFSSNASLNFIEKEKLQYVVAMPFRSSGLVEEILSCRGWIALKEGIDVCEFSYRCLSWGKARRIVVVRKDAEKLPNSGGKTLFSSQDQLLRYKYSAFVTNTDLSAELVWELYKKRADAENQIKELKHDYVIAGFNFKEMDATEFAFRWVIVAYNLMSFIRNRLAVAKVTHTLSTLRFNCIAIGCYLRRSSRKTKLMLAVTGKKRNYIEALFEKITGEKTFSTA